MTQQEFEKLSEKFQQGACNSEELSRLELWLAEEEKLTDNNSFFANETEEENTRQRIWLGLKEAIFPNNIKGVFQKSWLPTLYRVAGVIIAVVAVWWFSIKKTPSELNESIVGVESKNAGNSEQMIMLPDSSTVFLDVGASLVVDENFGKKNRVVQLTGGAYFEIKKNIQQPFLVYADGLITEVLGTSFHIKPEERNKKIEVSVVTGKVSVYTKGDGAKLKRDGVIVSPNQKIVYDKELKTIRQDLIDFPKILKQEEEVVDFNFNETTIEEVLNRVERSYGVEIVVVNPVIKKCKVSGNLNGIDMYKQLEFICDVINAKYELRGSSIFIIGNDCL